MDSEWTSPVTGDAFRDVIGRFATGVTVVTSHDEGGDVGMTASAVSSLSVDPPMLLVCINRRSRTGDAVHASGRFTVNVLAEDQAATAQRFAMPADDRFAGVPATRGEFGTLLLDGCLAYIDCAVQDSTAAATHHIITGRVQRVAARNGPPLAYFRGQFGQLHPAGDDAVTQLLREHVVATDDGRLDPVALAGAFGVDVGRIDRALSALRGEGLVRGNPRDGYHPTAVDARAVDDALSARLAIELGAIELAIDRRDPHAVAGLRQLADRTVGLLEQGRVTDVVAYATSNTAFHEALIGLAGSPALLDAYRRLSLHGILVRSPVEPGALRRDHGHDHVDIVEAIAAGDVDRARAVVRRHTERARQSHRVMRPA